MNIQSEKLEIMKLILETNNPGILNSIKKLFNPDKNADFWETLPQEQKDDILLGIKETENNETIDYEYLMSKHR